MPRLNWWQCGLLGALVLFVATCSNALHSLPRFFLKDVPWGELLYFPFQILLIGFAVGVIVRFFVPLAIWFGPIGDAMIGMIGMNVFFLLCMQIDSSPIPPFSSRAVPLFALATVLGILMGVLVGRDIRKEDSE